MNDWVTAKKKKKKKKKERKKERMQRISIKKSSPKEMKAQVSKQKYIYDFVFIKMEKRRLKMKKYTLF